ncbi:hypothetical protein [Wolbachia endosymbiont (group B) of Phalera bucephala]|uniref:hypothetical protein n=1 Tax=Wolbachia endosymbiont (group B) of Phalera bucephala TaxID=2954043 RepID=UPI00222EC268|nr:hypothetical protein [Wolbachia endosymbiont (group B) of Phalera bucephala]
MIANINTVALQGTSTVNVNAQIHMANGIPAFNIVGLVRPESLRSYCLKGEEFIQKETERILKLIKPDVLPSESTHQCESGNRLVPSDADNEPPLEKEDAQS